MHLSPDDNISLADIFDTFTEQHWAVPQQIYSKKHLMSDYLYLKIQVNMQLQHALQSPLTTAGVILGVGVGVLPGVGEGVAVWGGGGEEKELGAFEGERTLLGGGGVRVLGGGGLEVLWGGTDGAEAGVWAGLEGGEAAGT